MAMSHPQASIDEIARRGEEIYEQTLREQLEPEHVGKILVIDIETGEYETDDNEVAAGRRAMAKHPGHALYMKRIGYDAVHTFGGSLQPTKR